MKKYGFSLVELSIVLVILGLLVGGILSGQSLIRASELRATMNFLQEMKVKTNLFKEKYFQFPGDMTNATSFWPTTGNGNGDGFIDWSAENARFWWHLYLAGLDNSKTLNGNAHPQNYFVVPGQSRSAMVYIGSGTTYADLYSSNPPTGNRAVGKGLQISGMVEATWANAAVAKPEEVWGIDKKMDDGLPNSGDFLASNGRLSTDHLVTENCLTGTAPYTYAVSNSRDACRVMLLMY